jgi:hypothetical protein
MKTEIFSFKDAEVMDGFIKTYLKRYAPAGYSTEVKITIRQSYEDWKNNKLNYEVKITRDESCD